MGLRSASATRACTLALDAVACALALAQLPHTFQLCEHILAVPYGLGALGLMDAGTNERVRIRAAKTLAAQLNRPNVQHLLPHPHDCRR